MWIDGVCQQIADLMASPALSAILRAIEEQYNDATTLEDPREVWPCDVARIGSYPAVEVWCPDSSRIDPEDSALGYTHRLTIVWSVTGTDEKEIDRIVKRYLLATAKLLDGKNLGEASRPSQLIAGNCTYLVVDQENEESPFVRTAAIEFTTSTFEEPDLL